MVSASAADALPDRQRRPHPSRSSGNAVELLVGGSAFFPALIAAIDAAQSQVWLETYIFYDDATGRRVADALCRAAGRGVAVRLALDGFGTGRLSQALQTRFDAAGVQVSVFRPERFFNFSFRRLKRLHRKLALIDTDVAFVGGINILDDLVDPNHGTLDAPRFDFAVRIAGPLVLPIAQSMVSLWMRMHWRQRREYVLAKRSLRALSRLSWPRQGDVLAEFLLRDNFRNRKRIERAYLVALGRARHDVIVCNAYFFPGRRLRRALINAVQRGVRVRLLLQGRAEYPLQHYASRALYDDLLVAGVEIFEYRPSFLHAKVAVVDDRWATVGSSNIDPFSLLLAREANVVVRNAGFVDQLRGELEHTLQRDADAVVLDHHVARPWLVRLYNFLAYGVLRFGVLVAARGGKY